MSGSDALTSSQSDENARAGALPALAGVLTALLLVGLVAWVRVHFALADGEFDRQSPDGMLRSDPGLLYYLTERIVEAGGTPENFSEEPNIRFPDTADVPAMFTVGQEYLVAHGYRLFGGEEPLHLFALKLMALIAALSAAGVFGLTWELTRGAPCETRAGPWMPLAWAGLATLLYAIQPFTYRTLGVILIREDLSLPLFLLHLWMLARSLRTGGLPSALLSGLGLAGALATWHAMGFVVTLEVVVLTGWFLRTGESPFRQRRLAVIPVIVLLACLAVPVLRAKLFLFAPAMLLAMGLLAAGLLAGRSKLEARREGLVLFAAGLFGWFALGYVVRNFVLQDPGDYGHVFSFLSAKLATLGELPEDPTRIDFGARLLWQGPFSTASMSDFWLGLGSASCAALFAVALAIPGWLAGRGERGFLLLAGLVGASLASGWLVRRTLVLVAMLGPIAAAVWFARSRQRSIGLSALTVALLAQLVWSLQVTGFHRVDWYHDGRFELVDGKDARNLEQRKLVRFVRKNLPAGEPVLTDFFYATSLLAGAGTPMILQPKYETKESRDRIERYFTTFHTGSPADIAKLMDEWQARVLLVAPWDMMNEHAYAAGLPMGKNPKPGTAAFAFCNPNPEVFTKIPGFEPIYASRTNRSGVHMFRAWRRR